jgi:hypothetical protein
MTKRICGMSFISLWFLAGTGCQTFSISEEKFAAQQLGVYKQTPEAQAVEVSGFLLQFFGPWLACR